MKSTHNQYMSKEDAEKLVAAGRPTKKSSTYTRDDFLSPGQVAQKFNISTEEAKNLMKKLKFRNASFILNGHNAPAIVHFGKSGMYLHPLATEIAEQYLNNQKV